MAQLQQLQPFQGPSVDYSSAGTLTNGPLVNISGQLPGFSGLTGPWQMAPPTTLNMSQGLQNLSSMAGMGNLAGIGSNIINGLDSALTGMMGERAELSGKNAGLAQGLNSTYDTIQKVAGKFGTWGKVVQLGMAANKMVGNVVGKLGGGTDGQTKLDTVLGSPFFQMTPMGLINGFAGAKSSTFTKDEELFGQMGSSYGGASDVADQAAANAGKKYGAFSRGAMNEANDAIAEARRQQDVMSKINTDLQNKQAMVSSMGQTGYNAYQLALQGGYDQSNVRVGKEGLKFNNDQKFQSIFTNLQRSKQVLKSKSKKPGIISLPKLDNLVENKISIIKPLQSESINIIYPEEIIEFKEGGSFNVIPKGALHAHKHNMENAENLTKKGIPVVSENENGELEQHAEIEREEIIYRLSVTRQLEELCEKYNSDEYSQKEKESFAIEAGKLIVYETLYNTQDNVGLLQ